jgi:hypothetical protein
MYKLIKPSFKTEWKRFLLVNFVGELIANNFHEAMIYIASKQESLTLFMMLIILKNIVKWHVSSNNPLR